MTGTVMSGIARSDDDDTVTIRSYLRPVQSFLDEAEVIEVCINRPGEVYVERLGSGWTRVADERLTLRALTSLAVAVGRYSKQEFSQRRPLLSATLPGGERVQFVGEPCVERGTLAVVIRKPSRDVVSLEEFERQGLFQSVRILNSEIQPVERELQKLARAGQYGDFLRLAVSSRQNIIAAGATGSGKTRFLKGIAQLIPAEERLITMEDAREMFLPCHGNRVHLLFSRGQQSMADASAKELFEASMRMRPDRLLPAELRGGETFEFIRNGASGHPGCMSSVHGGSIDMTFEQMGLMIRSSDAGRDLPRADIQKLLRLVVNVIVQFTREGGQRFISGVYYDPEQRLRVADSVGVQ